MRALIRAGADVDAARAPRCAPVVSAQFQARIRSSACASTSQPSPAAALPARNRAQQHSRTRCPPVRAHHATEGQGYKRLREGMLYPQLVEHAQAPSAEDVQEILPLLTPKQLADAIWGFAKQGHKPTDEFMAVVAQEVHSKLDHFKSQDLSNTIWALAVLKYQPDKQWWIQFERQVYKNVTDFTARELANLMWALAILDHRPTWILDCVMGHALDNLPSYSANSLHLLVWSLAKLGHRPSEEWVAQFQLASQASFFQFTPSEMANVIWAFAKLGAKLPAMWLDNFLMVAQWRFPSFSAKLLSILVWSSAMLEHRPSAEWMVSFEQQVHEKFSEFNGQELACIAWALRRFGYTGDSNAVFYMLERQDSFSEVDFEILGNSTLLGQVMTWRGRDSSDSSSGSDNNGGWLN